MNNFYFLFLDEIYSPNLNDMLRLTKEDIFSHPSHKHFGLCGVILKSGDLYSLTKRLERFKQKYYPKQPNLISHYVDILNTRDSFSDLALDNLKSTAVHESLSSLVRDTKCAIDYIFIDKHGFAKKYGKFDVDQRLVRIKKVKSNMFPPASAKDYNLYLLSLKHLIKNYYNFLTQSKGQGIIVAEARGEREDSELRQAFNILLKEGVGTILAKDLRTALLDIYIVPKKQDYAGTQLADLLVYPIYDSAIPMHNIRNDHFIHYKTDIETKIINNSTHIIPT
jgi:hypothetical protein